MQEGNAIPNAAGEFKLRQAAGQSSDGFVTFADFENCIFLDLWGHTGVTDLATALAFVNDILERIEVGTTIVLLVSDDMWMSFRVTSEALVSGHTSIWHRAYRNRWIGRHYRLDGVFRAESAGAFWQIITGFLCRDKLAAIAAKS